MPFPINSTETSHNMEGFAKQPYNTCEPTATITRVLSKSTLEVALAEIQNERTRAHSHPNSIIRAATPAELDAAFESHLSRMAKGGTYGDNMEVVAFSKAYNVDLIIYKREHALCVKVDETSAAPKMLHIAYHVS